MMAHYAYKHACYDIDYSKYQALVAKFEQDSGRKHDGDSGYDGDNWYIMEMWIRGQIAEIAALRQKLEAAERRAYEFEGRYEECRVGWAKEQDRANKLADKLREAIEDAAIEWARYVEVDTAHITLPNHMMAAFDAAIAAGRKP